MDDSPNNTVTLHLTQLLDQHLLRDGRDSAFEIGESQQLASKQVEQDHKLPSPFENLECLLDTIGRRGGRLSLGGRGRVAVLLGLDRPLSPPATRGQLVAPRVVTGQFDPTRHRAIWPSTGNYARGGIAISRIMASRGVAILPEGMSRERFEWLQRWCENPEEDVIRTFGPHVIRQQCSQLRRSLKKLS